MAGRLRPPTAAERWIGLASLTWSRAVTSAASAAKRAAAIAAARVLAATGELEPSA